MATARPRGTHGRITRLTPALAALLVHLVLGPLGPLRADAFTICGCTGNDATGIVETCPTTLTSCSFNEARVVGFAEDVFGVGSYLSKL